ncbi:hypothetical protein [Methanobacterium sp.]|uniref:hypothetical protein n=1 Tax=Methanobacterium sp. TaxID=2164 RepID=UPI003D661166
MLENSSEIVGAKTRCPTNLRASTVPSQYLAPICPSSVEIFCPDSLFQVSVDILPP